jgi:hypothetical protein
MCTEWPPVITAAALHQLERWPFGGDVVSVEVNSLRNQLNPRQTFEFITLLAGCNNPKPNKVENKK